MSMRFATDLSKGILGSPDFDELWEEIISHISDEVLLKPDIRILNVACGHGTEARILAKRMITLGISKEKINESIYLIDKYKTFTGFVKKNLGFKNVITEDFLEWETDMKFDVVIGNPPYQSASAKQIKIWMRFLDKAFAILKDKSSQVIFLTPDVWVSDNNTVADQTREMLTDKTLLYVNMDANKYFSVGESICAFSILNQPNTGQIKTLVISNGEMIRVLFDGRPILLNDKQKIENSIYTKMVNSANPRTELRRVDGNGQKCAGHKSDIKTKDHCILVYFSFKDQFWTDLDFSNFQGPKLIFNNSGYYYKPGHNYIICENDAVAGNNAHQAQFNSELERDNAFQVYTSKLYRFFVDTFKTGGFNCTTIRRLPTVDFSRSWTAEELYKYFNLTQEEINYIESVVK